MEKKQRVQVQNPASDLCEISVWYTAYDQWRSYVVWYPGGLINMAAPAVIMDFKKLQLCLFIDFSFILLNDLNIFVPRKSNLFI